MQAAEVGYLRLCNLSWDRQKVGQHSKAWKDTVGNVSQLHRSTYKVRRRVIELIEKIATRTRGGKYQTKGADALLFLFLFKFSLKVGKLDFILLESSIAENVQACEPDHPVVRTVVQDLLIYARANRHSSLVKTLNRPFT
jgi:hypothetical protein